MASERRSRELSARLSRPFDWLPLVRRILLMHNSCVKKLVDTKKGDGWFLLFVDDMYKAKRDSSQAKMLARAHAFLHDFMPGCLTGRWSDIEGQDLMNILATYTESSVNRHSAIYAAKSLSETLEPWMKEGASREVVPGVDHDQPDDSRKKGTCQTTLLFSPAGPLVLLIVSYPDPKFRDWILSSHDSLDIRCGFWRCITADDFRHFHAKEPRESSVPSVADHRSLLGHSVIGATSDIRPFVPEWVGDLTLEDDLSGAEFLSNFGNASNACVAYSMSSINASSNVVADTGATWAFVAREKHLSPNLQMPVEKPQGGLAKKLLACGDEDVLTFWCTHWVKLMGEMPDYESQILIRSIFPGNIRRLLSLAYAAKTDALLLDIVDSGDLPKIPPVATLINRIQRLEKMPARKPLLDVETQLFELACGMEGQTLLEAAFDAQICFFQELVKDGHFDQHQRDIVDLAIAGIKVLRAVAGKDVEEAPTANSSIGPAFGLSFSPALKHSRWQTRVLAVLSLPAVLTAWQADDHRSPGQAIRAAAVELSHKGLAPIAEIANGHVVMSPEVNQILRKLFDDLSNTNVAGSQQGSRAGASSKPEPFSSPPDGQATPPQDTTVACGPMGPVSEGVADELEGAQTDAPACADTSRYSSFWTATHTAKRAASPDVRDVKMPRLAGNTAQDDIDELKEDIKNVSRAVEQLKAEFLLLQDGLHDVAKERLKGSATRSQEGRRG